jgi:hypothetical protein
MVVQTERNALTFMLAMMSRNNSVISISTTVAVAADNLLQCCGMCQFLD